MNEPFVLGKDVMETPAGEGVLRKVLAHSPGIMMVQIDFAQGAIGASHAHPHEQVTYIISGRFQFTNGGEEWEVGPGDSLYFAPGVQHGTVCVEAGRLLDVFTPCREDFLK